MHRASIQIRKVPGLARNLFRARYKFVVTRTGIPFRVIDFRIFASPQTYERASYDGELDRLAVST
jgi:hypothetical protein